MLLQIAQLAIGIGAALVALVFAHIAVDLFRRGAEKISVSRAEDYGLRTFLSGGHAKPVKSSSGVRLNRGWHARVDKDGRQVFANGSTLTDEFV